ncbi:MAG: acyltransferase family protein, partial [Lachnospiraceae bacterium]
HTGKEFAGSRTLRLLIPSTIGVLVFHFLQGYVSMSLGNAFEDLSNTGVPGPVIFMIMVASGSGVLWFCHLLWIYSMLLLLVRMFEKDRLLSLGTKASLPVIFLFFFPVWGAGQILNTPIVSVYRCAFYFVFFLLGYYVFSNDPVMKKLKRYAVPFIAFGTVLCIAFSIRYFWVQKGANYADTPVNRGPLYAACAYFGSLAVLAGFARFGDFRNSFTEWMSKRS